MHESGRAKEDISWERYSLILRHLQSRHKHFGVVRRPQTENAVSALELAGGDEICFRSTPNFFVVD